MSKRKIATFSKEVHSNEQIFPDSGFYSDDIQPPTLKHLTQVTTVKETAPECLRSAFVVKPAVHELTAGTASATPKYAKKHLGVTVTATVKATTKVRTTVTVTSDQTKLPSPQVPNHTGYWLRKRDTPTMGRFNNPDKRAANTPTRKSEVDRKFDSKLDVKHSNYIDPAIIKAEIKRDFVKLYDQPEPVYRQDLRALFNTYDTELHGYVASLQIHHTFELKSQLENSEHVVTDLSGELKDTVKELDETQRQLELLR